MQRINISAKFENITAMLTLLFLFLVLTTIRTEARPMHGPADPLHCPPGMGPGEPGMEWGRRGRGRGGSGVDWGRRGMGSRWQGGSGMGPRGQGMIGPEGPRGRGLGRGNPNTGDDGSKLEANA
ncbi:unnamed protein product [Cylicocyclus nassatus]|uniref:Sp185/333 n=1 Tax=Cylicocyclus nassatus TaxID=53992 RepID=A0AA36H0V4_CYLNA|nr:unnamed protein product [Cylicocyclus nassatus]